MRLDKEISFDEFLGSKEFFEYSYPKEVRTGNSIATPLKGMSDYKIITPSDYLVAFSSQSHLYCVGCIDMVGSTKISASIPSQKLSGYYEVFLNSMSKIISRFGGKVIKNIGDCLLYYFPESKDFSMLDSFGRCLDCGLAMISAQSIICRQLTSQGLPCISYRVSADCGRVLVMSTTDSTSIDLIGPPVNMCTKINHCASPNEFVIGGDLYEMVKRLGGYSLQQLSGYNVGFKHSYPVYKVSLE